LQEEVLAIKHYLGRGFTLVQFIIVIAIVSVLVTLAVPVYQSSKRSSVQTDLSNEIANLFMAQRSRAMGSNLAMMVIIDNSEQSIQPLVGSNASCESPRLPIAYPGAEDAEKPLMIKLTKGSGQTTEFSSTNTYEEIVEFLAALSGEDGAAMDASVMLCFQSNGSVRFFNPASSFTEYPEEYSKLSMRVWQKKSGTRLGRSLNITINRFGSVVSEPGS
jgi:Tfp pilus assembly protein FimT